MKLIYLIVFSYIVFFGLYYWSCTA
jgi:hypothetical protein